MVGLPEGTLTFVLTDVEGSTKAWESAPTMMRETMARHDQLIAERVERHGGVDVHSGRAGDSTLTVFRRATDAALCAVAIQRAFAGESWPNDGSLRLRIALHSGEAQLREGQYYGQALNRCARLLATAHGGQTLITQATEEMLVDELPSDVSLRDLGFHRLKDLARPEHVFELVDIQNPRDFPPIRSMRRELTNLPIALTSFIGRDADLAQLREALPGLRLLTITGPAGAGKTRLAIKLAWEFVTYYPDGVWLTELGGLADQHLVAQEVANVLGLREQPGVPLAKTLREQLADRRMLLVLDNCEHMVGAVADLVSDLLQHCERLEVLATSREPLRIAGEAVRRVDALQPEEALQLFSARARLQNPGFEVSDENVQLIARICQRLDRLPLAIELAAARVAVMPLTEIFSRLQERFSLLTGGERGGSVRVKTLRAALDWSFELLSAQERILFNRLSVFADRFSLEAVERVCTDAALPRAAVLETLGGLVEKSMIAVRDGRYRCLETLRAYGRERLEDAGETDQLAAALAQYLLWIAEGRQAGQLAGWLDRVEAWYDDVVASLEWALAHDPELGARLTVALGLFFQLRSHASVPRGYADALLRRLSPDSTVWPALLHISGAFSYIQGDLEAARRRLDESVNAGHRSGDRLTEVRALETRGLVEVAAGDVSAAQATLEQALQLSRQHQLLESEAAILHQLGLQAIRAGDQDRATALFDRSIEIRRSMNRADEASMPLTFRAAVALLTGDLETAQRSVIESLDISRALRDRRAAWSLEVFACILALKGEADLALRLAGAGTAMHEAAGSHPSPTWAQTVKSLIEPARTRVGEAAAKAAWGAGERLNMNEAFDLALQPQQAYEVEPLAGAGRD